MYRVKGAAERGTRKSLSALRCQASSDRAEPWSFATWASASRRRFARRRPSVHSKRLHRREGDSARRRGGRGVSMRIRRIRMRGERGLTCCRCRRPSSSCCCALAAPPALDGNLPATGGDGERPNAGWPPGTSADAPSAARYSPSIPSPNRGRPFACPNSSSSSSQAWPYTPAGLQKAVRCLSKKSRVTRP